MAGLWDHSDASGNWYAGMMTDCNGVVRLVNKRMPVLLHEDEYDTWLRGCLEDAMAYQGRCFPDELILMGRTAEPWFKPRKPAPELPVC